MPKVFLSHKSEDKALVLKAEKHLNNALIETWIDKSGLQGGCELSPAIKFAIEEHDIFMAFISEAYLNSPWCKGELRVAVRKYKKDKTKSKIILIPMVSREVLEEKANVYLMDIIDEIKSIPCLEADDDFFKSLYTEIWLTQPVQFYPIQNAELEGRPIQIISMHYEGILKPEMLKDWIDLEKFTSQIPNDTSKPIRFDSGLAIFGRGTNWMYAYLTTPAANKRDVYIYNTYTSEFICVYARSNKSLLGSKYPYPRNLLPKFPEKKE